MDGRDNPRPKQNPGDRGPNNYSNDNSNNNTCHALPGQIPPPDYDLQDDGGAVVTSRSDGSGGSGQGRHTWVDSANVTPWDRGHRHYHDPHQHHQHHRNSAIPSTPPSPPPLPSSGDDVARGEVHTADEESWSRPAAYSKSGGNYPGQVLPNRYNSGSNASHDSRSGATRISDYNRGEAVSCRGHPEHSLGFYLNAPYTLQAQEEQSLDIGVAGSVPSGREPGAVLHPTGLSRHNVKTRPGDNFVDEGDGRSPARPQDVAHRRLSSPVDYSGLEDLLELESTHPDFVAMQRGGSNNESGRYDNSAGQWRGSDNVASKHRYVKRMNSSEPPADYGSGHVGPREFSNLGYEPDYPRHIQAAHGDRGYFPRENEQSWYRDGGGDGGVGVEMHSMEEGRRGSSRHYIPHQQQQREDTDFVDRSYDLRHRRGRSKSQRSINGYDYYRRLQHHVNAGFTHHDDDDDYDWHSVESLNVEDRRKFNQILATMRVRRKTRKQSSKKKKEEESPNEERDRVDRQGEGWGEDNDDDDDDTVDYEEQVGLPSAREKIKGLTEKLLQTKQVQSTRETAEHYRDNLWALDHEGIKLTSRHVSKQFKRVGGTLSDILYRINFWSQQFKEIEGHSGIATATYFRFTRWLVKINFLVFFLFLCFIYIPQLTYDTIFEGSTPVNVTTNQTDSYKRTYECSRSYTQHLALLEEDETAITKVLDVVSGTGIIENTVLFYGYYSNLSFWVTDDEGQAVFQADYNMGLAYILTVGFSFVLLFIMSVRNSSNTIKETVIDLENNAFPKYTNAVFGGWDYCINSEKMAFFKHKIIFNEFKADLAEVEFKRRKENRSAGERSKLYAKRFAINVIVVAILGAAFYTIYIATDFLLEKQREDLSFILALLVQYMPSIIISGMNLFIPEVFLKFAKLEEYSHSFGTHITIVRAVFLRLAMVGVLIVSLYYSLQYEPDRTLFDCPEEFITTSNVSKCCGNSLWIADTTKNETVDRGSVKCWETYVGQQFYKLVLADFVTVTLVVFLLAVPRKYIHKHLKNKLWIVAKVGKAKFDLPLEVLDIVYSQTLCWIGMFFAPLLPALTFVKVFYFFFLKKFQLLHFCELPKNAYRASRSYSFFQTVLLVSFIMIACLLGYMIGNIQPSKSCGPFRLYSSEDYVMFTSVTNEVNSWPSIPKNIFRYFGTVAFFLPAFLILLLAIYYYWATSQGYKKMEELLRQQLKSEAHDKQYLLARVDEVIKKGELVSADDHPF